MSDKKPKYSITFEIQLDDRVVFKTWRGSSRTKELALERARAKIASQINSFAELKYFFH